MKVELGHLSYAENASVISYKNSDSNFQWKGDIRNCSCYRAIKLIEHRMKVVERELKNGFLE